MTTRRLVLLLAALPVLAACGQGLTLVTPNRLVPGDGGSGTSARPTLDIVVRMEADATDFNPWDLMVLTVDGVDRTRDVALGGYYAILRLDPPPAGPAFVELSRRLSEPIDSFTWTTAPYTGPTLASVSPGQARVGETVTLSGTGLDAGAPRVFFGGAEGTVESSSATSIVARVPDEAAAGLVWVVVGADAAEGVVGFTPLDAADQPLPLPTEVTLFGCFPARGPVETPVRVYGVAFTDESRPWFNERENLRLLGIETVTVPGAGEMLAGWAVPERNVPTGAGDFRVRNFDGTESNRLPFTVDP